MHAFNPASNLGTGSANKPTSPTQPLQQQPASSFQPVSNVVYPPSTSMIAQPSNTPSFGAPLPSSYMQPMNYAQQQQFTAPPTFMPATTTHLENQFSSMSLQPPLSTANLATSSPQYNMPPPPTSSVGGVAPPSGFTSYSLPAQPMQPMQPMMQPQPQQERVLAPPPMVGQVYDPRATHATPPGMTSTPPTTTAVAPLPHPSMGGVQAQQGQPVYSAPPTNFGLQGSIAATTTQQQVVPPQQQTPQQYTNLFGGVQQQALTAVQQPVNYSNLYGISTSPSQQFTSAPMDGMGGMPAQPQRPTSEKLIDPNQIPGPAKRKYPECYVKKTFHTVQEAVPPPSYSRFRTIDQGNCNPRFMRPTLNAFPTSSDILNQTSMVMGAVVTPLADQDEEDQPNVVPVVDFAESGPIRCTRCRAYINPFVTFVEAGKRFVCNFCTLANEVPRWYMGNLDSYGKRRDIDERPELKYGSVDFVASKEYIQREPQPLSYVFVIDISNNASSQGIFNAVATSIRKILKEIAVSHSRCKVALITYSKTVHFYNIKASTHPQIMIMGDVNDVFVPMSHDALITVGELAEKGDEVIHKLISNSSHMQENENCLGSALVAAATLFEGSGGKIICFSSNYPSIGPGRLQAREDYKLYGTDKERGLFVPQLGFWKNLGIGCAKKQISIDMYLFPTSFIESTTLGSVCTTTNGHLHVYPNFNEARDTDRLYNALRRNVVRETGYEGIMRVRCSAGLSVKRYFGNYHEQTADDMDLPGVDADSSFVVEFKHDYTIDEKQNQFVYIQAAMLYTHRSGARLVRVHTLRLPIATSVASAFKFADLDALMSVYSRFAVVQVTKNRDLVQVARDQLTIKSVEILSSYRKHCSSGSNPGQLILPEALKLLPVYFLGLTKTPALRHGTDVNLDERIAALGALMSYSPSDLMQYCYPRLFALHDFPKAHTDEDGTDYPLPPLLSLTSAAVDANAVYLLDDGYSTFFWVGRYANPEVLKSVFNVPNFESLPADKLPEPDLSNPHGARVAAILEELKKKRARFGPFRTFRERDQGENQFYARLIEDRNVQSKSYVEHLCHLHREIQTKLAY